MDSFGEALEARVVTVAEINALLYLPDPVHEAGTSDRWVNRRIHVVADS